MTMKALEIKNLCKSYGTFSLRDVSFCVDEGSITGFIGRNGAGKSTTLSCLFDFVHPSSGEVLFFSKPLCGNEGFVAKNVGFVSGSVDFYTKKKLKTIAKITSEFNESWDESAYRRYMKLFSLDESKTPSTLSQGMKTKFALCLALSHGAKLLILDEPTSGLDAVSRDELLEIFMALRDEGASILFSTHVISDLEKCADSIVYIQKGQIIFDGSADALESAYLKVEYSAEPSDEEKKLLIGKRRTKSGFSSLVKKENAPLFGGAKSCSIEEIMLHLEKEESL